MTDTGVSNLLLITIDSLRKDATNPPGSPLFDRLEAEGVSFEQAFATGPGTSPSFPGLLTGTLPLSYDGLGPLTSERPRLALQFRNQGYSTAGFQCNPFLSTRFGYDVGFETYEDYQNPLMGLATRVFPRGIEINNRRIRRIDDVLHLTDAIKRGYQAVRGKPRPYVSAQVITDDAVEWLETATKPFFCWAHYMDVHHPCFPPETYRTRVGAGDISQTEVARLYSTALDSPGSLTSEESDTLRGLYRASIAYVFDQIDRLLALLERRDLSDETLIVVTSDHGELFGEYGSYGKPERMYDELLHVPLVVLNGPDYLEDAASDLVSLLDVPPLIHDALGVDVPDGYTGGRPGKDQPREYIVAEHDVGGDVVIGARSRDWLFEADEIRDERRLYDLRGGAFQRADDAEAPETRLVRRAVNDRLAELDPSAYELETDVDGSLESRLEDLGYL